MSIVRNQQSLYNLISTKLDLNSYDVRFNSDLFNSNEINYYDEETNGRRKRFVPTMISDVVGEYLNVPNSNTTINNVGVQFDIFVGTQTQDDYDDYEFENVQYSDTLNAIEEFKATLLARYFPLGTAYVYMGGEDSSISISKTSGVQNKSLYIKFVPKNTDSENIITFSGGTEIRKLTKTSTHIRWFYGSGASDYIQIPYTVNVEKELYVIYTGTAWVISDGTDTATYSVAFGSDVSSTSIMIGGTTGLECLLKAVAIGNTALTSFNLTNASSIYDDWYFYVDTWGSKDVLTNQADSSTGIISNCILWSEDGNAVFSFGTLNPISDIRAVDSTSLYQMFEIEINCVISNDVLFGNNFEYYLSTDDGASYEQIYPIDRQHTLGTSGNTDQLINDNESTTIIEESLRDITQSFYYIPSKKLTKLLKHVVSGTTAQNTTYKLKVQYPFFQVTYDVVVDAGGTSPNLNTISSFTVTYKKSLL